jgi:hypothetical protein
MNPREVRVHHASVEVEADDAASAIATVRAAERALPAALDGLADDLGDEVLVIRSLELAASVLVSGHAVAAHELRRALRDHLRERIDDARRAATAARGPDYAWYPSEAEAIADYLGALHRGEGGRWPYRALAGYGADFAAVLRDCLARGAALAGDVLAALARAELGGALASRVDAALAAALVAAWASAPAPGGEATDWRAFPAEVRARVAARALADLAGAASGAAPDVRRLLALAHLFAAWPPARALRFAARDLIAASAPAPEGAAASEAAATRRVSRAGGLVFWARVLADIGLERALVEAYAEERVRRAARWALGRGLESASCEPRDPLLLAWSGEEPGAAAFPSLVLERADPEPLHAAALRAAAELGYLEAPLRAVPFGGGVAAMGAQGLVADWLPGAADLHDAVSELVQRYAARAGCPPAAVEVEERLATADLDAIAEIDAPAVPDRWRPALWAAASLVRAAAAERWRVRQADARGWPAIVVGDEGVEIPRRHVEAIAAGAWLTPWPPLGGRAWRIVVVS